MKTFKQMRENVTSDDDYKAKKKALQDIQNDPKQAAIVGRDKLVQRKDKLDKDYQDYKSKTNIAASTLRYSVKFAMQKGGKIANAFYKDKEEAEKFVKSVIAKGGKAIMTTEEVKEDAPANAVGDGSNLAMPPSHEPGVHVKKKKKELTSLLRREDYDKVEVENLINKIETNQEIEENQIKPILNNIKSKKEKGTYTEDFGMTAFRYVVDNQITSTVSENFRNKVASELLSKYV
tara:strand:+ start:520 stop:1221 length:702 start_codon:yes stop_codon:yes gene_type:complete